VKWWMRGVPVGNQAREQLARTAPSPGWLRSAFPRAARLVEDTACASHRVYRGALDRDLSVARLAGIAEIGVTRLKARFRRSTGLPVRQYVVQRRVVRARALLPRGDLPLSQIALDSACYAAHRRLSRRLPRAPPTCGSMTTTLLVLGMAC
jgi:AraC-like DNA-binding protein